MKATVSADSLNGRIEFLTRLLHCLATLPTLSAPPAMLGVIGGPKERSRSIGKLVRNTTRRCDPEYGQVAMELRAPNV